MGQNKIFHQILSMSLQMEILLENMLSALIP